jgi:transcriptional regulator with XRE-family HTH domain
MKRKHPIKAYRERHNLTLEAFGTRVGVQRSAVSKWERGEGPSIDNAKGIEAATRGEIPKHVLRPDIWAKEKTS